jgi:AcrR family transcriptional regulator
VSAKRRAITDEQKQARRQMLIDAAWELFQTQPYEEVSIAEVAEAAGLAKGTVYLYFQTKEELFLAIQEQQFETWFDALDARLRELAGCGDVEQVAGLVCRSLAERPAMARLFAILHPILERNVGYQAALRLKQTLLEHLASTGALLEACLPSLAPGWGVQFGLWFYAFVLGLQQLANPAPVVREVIEREPGMAAFDIDFSGQCAEVTAALLYGLQAASGRQ